ncbi:YneF family protein [Mycoplasmopsis opalescens]|uniref:YneF family protein n=1 Tax=Mycoplasmopsis opalescens TaxID=114886 RepID=UPI0004A6B7C0|nr:YneF family protein [Mycoplasmopsis opalescens]
MSTGGWIGVIIAVAVVVALVAGFLGFYIARKLMEKQLRENPPISEKMIRVMFEQMGRKASETQIRNVMRSMTNAKNNEK